MATATTAESTSSTPQEATAHRWEDGGMGGIVGVWRGVAGWSKCVNCGKEITPKKFDYKFDAYQAERNSTCPGAKL
jgi:hypothetical protein